MNKNTIEHRLASITINTWLKLRFRDSAIASVQKLLNLELIGYIEIHSADLIACYAVKETNNWEKDCNRTIRVRITNTEYIHFFVNDISDALEAMDLLESHALQKIVTRNADKQKAECHAFINSWLTNEFLAEFLDWGIDIHHQFYPNETTPYFVISLVDAQNIFFTLEISCWSGVLSFTNGTQIRRRFKDPTQIQQILRDQLTKYIEHLQTGGEDENQEQ